MSCVNKEGGKEGELVYISTQNEPRGRQYCRGQYHEQEQKEAQEEHENSIGKYNKQYTTDVKGGDITLYMGQNFVMWVNVLEEKSKDVNM